MSESTRWPGNYPELTPLQRRQYELLAADGYDLSTFGSGMAVATNNDRDQLDVEINFSEETVLLRTRKSTVEVPYVAPSPVRPVSAEGCAALALARRSLTQLMVETPNQQYTTDELVGRLDPNVVSTYNEGGGGQLNRLLTTWWREHLAVSGQRIIVVGQTKTRRPIRVNPRLFVHYPMD